VNLGLAGLLYETGGSFSLFNLLPAQGLQSAFLGMGSSTGLGMETEFKAQEMD